MTYPRRVVVALGEPRPPRQPRAVVTVDGQSRPDATVVVQPSGALVVVVPATAPTLTATARGPVGQEWCQDASARPSDGLYGSQGSTGTGQGGFVGQREIPPPARAGSAPVPDRREGP